MKARRQLTLYVPELGGQLIDEVRRAVDPLQAAKINAHITLAYDDELPALDALIASVEGLSAEDLRFDFWIGEPRGFEKEKRGIYLDAIDRIGSFDRTREKLLGQAPQRRHHVTPHITLLHPRNARDTDDGWAIVRTADFPTATGLCPMALIELGSSGWKVVRDFPAKT